MAEKSVIASISQAEERHFKTLQLPALRAVVSEPAPQKRRFFLLLFLSASANSRNEAQTVGGAWLLPSAERGHTAAHTAKQGRFSLLSAFRPTGRLKWVRASARNCSRRIAGRDACPALSENVALIHLFTLQRLIFISSDFHHSPFTETVPYFCRSLSQ